MFGSQAIHRTLYEAIQNYQGDALYQEILLPAAPDLKSDLAGLSHLREPAKAEPEESCRLYSLSRVVEILLLNFQEPRLEDWAPRILLSEFAEFWNRAGLAVLDLPPQHPFFVENMEASPKSQLWPALMFGSLLICRAGMEVPTMAPALYWSHRRRDREYHDLSHGWGGNSQWRTRFRRDYAVEETLIYNLDGHAPIDQVSDDLSFDLRRQLLRERTLSTLPENCDGEFFPYDYRWQERLSDQGLGGISAAVPCRT